MLWVLNDAIQQYSELSLFVSRALLTCLKIISERFLLFHNTQL